jgi:hypothetical protein
MTDPTSRQRWRAHKQECNFLKIKINKQIFGHMPQMEHGTKTDRLTDCQSQCDFDLARNSHFHLLSVASHHQLPATTTTARQQHNYLSGDRRSASVRLLAQRSGQSARASLTQQTSEALQSQLR